MSNHSFVAFQSAACDRRKRVGDSELRKIKIGASELQAKYADLENEIRLLRDLRSEVNGKLKKQVQSISATVNTTAHSISSSLRKKRKRGSR
jgi:uncharacterized coiled-coil DUF342 family protein